MITDALLLILKGLIDLFMAGLPDWQMTLPEGTGTFVSTMKTWDSIVPIHEMLTVTALIVGVVLLITGVKWTIKLIDWVADVMP